MSWSFHKVEFSLRAGFFGYYVTPDGKKLWVCPLPFVALYFKKD